MGAIKTMKEVESALPQKKEINYVRALDKNGNPILINKEDLAQVDYDCRTQCDIVVMGFIDITFTEIKPVHQWCNLPIRARYK